MGFEKLLERTMLIERSCGVLLYVVVLVYVYSALKRANSYGKVCKILNLYNVILLIMAFFYIPYKSADLYRWIDMTDKWYTYSFGEFFERRMLNSATPVAELMIYMCRITRVDGVLPAFCSFVFFSNVFYILKDQYKNHNASSKVVACALLALMSTGCFVGVISGVRCFVALSILARCFYDEIFNEKTMTKNILWEIVACLIHSMGIVILAIRSVFFIIQKGKSFLRKVFDIILVITLCFFIIKYGQIYIELAFDKADAYVSSAEFIKAYSGEYIIGCLVVLQLLIYFLTSQKKDNRKLKNAINFNLLIMIVEVAYIFEFNIFHRTVTFSSIMILPLICQLKLEEERDERLIKNLNILSILILLVSCVRGDLTAYKFFLL